MAIPINFKKRQAETLLNALKSDAAIEGPWTVARMLEVAGALHFALMSHGPMLNHGVDRSHLNSEQREATEETVYADLIGAIEFYSHLTMQVQDGKHDESFEENFSAIISHDDDGRHVTPIKGHKK